MGTYAVTEAVIGDLVIGIDHIGLCVRSLEDAGAGWAALLGKPVVDREKVSSVATEVAFVRMGDSAAIELITPMEDNPALARFLDKRGDALHHVAIAVTDIDEAVRRLVAADIEMIDRAPRTGAGGHQVAFIHPRAMGGVLVELLQKSEALGQ